MFSRLFTFVSDLLASAPASILFVASPARLRGVPDESRTGQAFKSVHPSRGIYAQQLGVGSFRRSSKLVRDGKIRWQTAAGVVENVALYI